MKKISDGFVRVDRIDLKSLDEQLKKASQQEHHHRWLQQPGHRRAAWDPNLTVVAPEPDRDHECAPYKLRRFRRSRGGSLESRTSKTVIVVTPTYARTFQALQLTGVMHSLMLVPYDFI
ncbi:hypothetical protein FF1_003323 [Malus domestica]